MPKPVTVLIVVIWVLLLASFWSLWFSYAAGILYSGGIVFFWLREKREKTGAADPEPAVSEEPGR